MLQRKSERNKAVDGAHDRKRLLIFILIPNF